MTEKPSLKHMITKSKNPALKEKIWQGPENKGPLEIIRTKNNQMSHLE